MIIISYDISDDKTRNQFVKMLTRQGAIRLQLSVYEINNTRRIIDNLKTRIEAFSRHFTMNDSVIIFEVNQNELIKYGHAIHRDQSVVYL